MKLKKNICNRAIKCFKGNDPYYAFILPDGTILSMDTHLDISKAYNKDKGYDKIKTFMKDCHAVRTHAFDRVSGAEIRQVDEDDDDIELMVHSIHKPTSEQAKLIGSLFENVTNFLAFKTDVHEKNVCEYEKEYPRPMNVQNWISKCW